MKEKRKGIAKVMALKNWSCEDIKENVAPEIGPKSFETFEKHGPVSQMSWDFSGLFRVPLFPATGFSGPKRSRNFRETGPRARYTKQINPDFSLHNPITIGRHQLFTHERVLRFGSMLKKTTTALWTGKWFGLCLGCASLPFAHASHVRVYGSTVISISQPIQDKLRGNWASCSNIVSSYYQKWSTTKVCESQELSMNHRFKRSKPCLMQRSSALNDNNILELNC